MEIENSRLAGLSNLYKNNIEKLDHEKKEILKKTKAEADEYLRDINKKVEKVIKDLKESHAKSEVIKESQSIIKEIKEINKNLFKEEVDLKPEIDNFTVGDIATIKNTGSTGEIIEISKDGKKATLRIGSVKMQADFSNLVKAKKEETKTQNIYSGYDISVPQFRLDIRGERSEEAEFEVIKFLDEAYSSGMDRVEILHGKGTGALKKTVQDILKSHEKVKKFYFAPIEFGGDGITIAEFN